MTIFFFTTLFKFTFTTSFTNHCKSLTHATRIMLTSLAPSSHWELSMSILKLNVKRALGMSTLLGLQGLYEGLVNFFLWSQFPAIIQITSTSWLVQLIEYIFNDSFRCLTNMTILTLKITCTPKKLNLSSPVSRETKIWILVSSRKLNQNIGFSQRYPLLDKGVAWIRWPTAFVIQN